MTKPLTRPSTRLCPGCQRQRPLGHFAALFNLDGNPRTMKRVETEVCRDCRNVSRARR